MVKLLFTTRPGERRAVQIGHAQKRGTPIGLQERR
jgi:hypothetical protein